MVCGQRRCPAFVLIHRPICSSYIKTKAIFPPKFCKILGKIIHLPPPQKSAALPVLEQEDFLPREKPPSSMQLCSLHCDVPHAVVTGHGLAEPPRPPCAHTGSDTGRVTCAYLTAPRSSVQGPTNSYNNCTANLSGMRTSSTVSLGVVGFLLRFLFIRVLFQLVISQGSLDCIFSQHYEQKTHISRTRKCFLEQKML